jgi:hypothetical protein
MNAFEFLQMGFRVPLMPSSLSLAALGGGLLLELKRTGNDREYFAKRNSSAETEVWYKKLGSTRKLV